MTEREYRVAFYQWEDGREYTAEDAFWAGAQLAMRKAKEEQDNAVVRELKRVRDLLKWEI